MRRLVAGIVLGLILGMAGEAGAVYLHDGAWFRLDRQAQTAYVAGVADTLGSIAGFSAYVGPDRAIERVTQAARCADRIPLGHLAGWGTDAIERARHSAPPSTAIIQRFVACGRPYYGSPENRPYYWSPDGQPSYYWGPGGQPPFTNRKDAGDR